MQGDIATKVDDFKWGLWIVTAWECVGNDHVREQQGDHMSHRSRGRLFNSNEQV